MSEVRDSWTNFFKSALDLAYCRSCALCGTFGSDNPCVQCQGEMDLSDPSIEVHFDSPLAFTGSVYRYTGRPGQAVRLLKYARRTSLADFMSRSIREAIETAGIESDLVVPVPIHWTRLMARGFNQAELISGLLPFQPHVLRRTRATQSQAGLNSSERLKNLTGAFQVLESVKGRSVLLIDDVVTSGQTFGECAKVLREAGATEVGGFAFCGDV